MVAVFLLHADGQPGIRPQSCGSDQAGGARSSKATDLSATEPTQVVRTIVDRRLVDRYDYALQTLNEVPYDQWREYDAEDTVRFYALWLHEAGMIKSDPKKIIADKTDWPLLERAQT